MVLSITTDTIDDETMEVCKERRNGMGNIFEGIESQVLHRLGWTKEALREAEKCRTLSGSSVTESECSDYFSDFDRDSEADVVDHFNDLSLSTQPRCMGNRSRDCSCSSEMDIAHCFSNRKRRNGLADLFEALSVPQKQLFVQLIQRPEHTGRITGCA